MINFNAFYRFTAFIAVTISIGLTQHKTFAATCPCDIYATGGTPCVGAFSTVRLLNSTYTGPLYQVRRTSDNTTKDIYPLTGGTVANAASQDSFLGTGAGSFSKLYDQSGTGNHLVSAPGGCYSGGTGTALQADYETNAKALSLMVGGYKAYGMSMLVHDGYRNNTTKGVATGTQAQSVYEVVDGKRYNNACCWDFGNAETNNCGGATGTMNSVYFGNDGMWGKGSGSGPWFMGDFEAGIWSGGAGSFSTNANDSAITCNYAFGMVKTSNNGSQPTYCIRVGNGGPTGSANLITAWDGNFVTTWKMQGAIILGIGGDNSNSAYGTFFEGAITSGRPSNATDSLVLKNVQAAGYGVTTSTLYIANGVAVASLFKVNYNPSIAKAVISYTLQDATRVRMNIFDQRGRRVAAIVDDIIPAGRHEAVWDTKRVPAGAYMCRMAIDGMEGWAEKIIVGK